jgi:hypothetical protein
MFHVLVFTPKPRPRKINVRRIIRNHIVDKADENNLKYLIDKLSEKNYTFPLSIYELGEKPFNILDHFKSFEVIHMIKTLEEIKEILYINKSGFYIYVNKKDFQFCDVKILFEPVQLSEVEFFINRLSKLK